MPAGVDGATLQRSHVFRQWPLERVQGRLCVSPGVGGSRLLRLRPFRHNVGHGRFVHVGVRPQQVDALHAHELANHLCAETG